MCRSTVTWISIIMFIYKGVVYRTFCPTKRFGYLLTSESYSWWCARIKAPTRACYQKCCIQTVNILNSKKFLLPFSRQWGLVDREADILGGRVFDSSDILMWDNLLIHSQRVSHHFMSEVSLRSIIWGSLSVRDRKCCVCPTNKINRTF